MLLLLAVLKFLISPDDVLHESVPDNIQFGKIDKFDAFNSLKDIFGLNQPRCPFGRKVYLGDVSGDDRF